MNKIFADLPNTIFDVMSQAARDLNAINLGQGFPDDPGPLDVRQKAADAVLNGYNQYPSMMGIPELRQAIATHYAHWHGLQLDPMSEVMVTSGATEALTGSILGLVAARRRGAAVPANVRFLRADHPAGRRHSQIPAVWSRRTGAFRKRRSALRSRRRRVM
jgi:aspartate/methionine/tyrosine aminotransferase